MTVRRRFHTDARREYADAAEFYAREAAPRIVEEFIDAIERGLAAIAQSPTRWRVVRPPDVRRCTIERFPYAIIYRMEVGGQLLEIYAIAHNRRAPDYWHARL